jgi:membrane protein
MDLVQEEFRNYLRRFRDAEIPTRAAALAYHSLLAIVPMLGLFFWYLSRIGVTEKCLILSKQFILEHLNVNSSGNFEHVFQTLTSTVAGRSWGWVGLLLLLYTSFSLIKRFGESLDVILGTALYQPQEGWSSVKLAVRRVAVMLLLPIALSFSLVVTQWIRSDSTLHRILDPGRLGHYITFMAPVFDDFSRMFQTAGSYLMLLIPLAVDVMVFFLVYHFIPKKPVPWREALKAAAVVTPISEVTRFAFSLYNGYAVSVHKLYGVLAAVPMFILWVQIAWLVILCGALVIHFKPVISIDYPDRDVSKKINNTC